MESLILWLGVEDPFFKFLIAFGVLTAILFLAILIPSIILGVVLGLFSQLLSPKGLSNSLFYSGLKKEKKKGNPGLFSFPDNREEWTRRDIILKRIINKNFNS